TIPAVIAGLLFEDLIATSLRSPLVVAFNLVLFSGALLWVECSGAGMRDETNVTWRDGLLIGCAQAVALFPGVSRSGITIAAGMAPGMRREASARFAFLLSAPIIAGAGAKEFINVAREGSGGALLPIAAGILASAVVGYVVIRFLLHFLARHSLDVFVAYRVALAAIVTVAYFVATSR
ncbi:MAG: undecaprenyl-diphosphate phosphatase, partial [Chloroflexi bacterium]|nr:undecaprenyl-diphosphate phosphatase [Chloroflexota bacterium]